MGVFPKRGDQRLGHVLDHVDLIIIAVRKQFRDVRFKLRPCVYQIVTEKIINRDTQGVGKVDNGGNADLSRASFNVADVSGERPDFSARRSCFISALIRTILILLPIAL